MSVGKERKSGKRKRGKFERKRNRHYTKELAGPGLTGRRNCRKRQRRKTKNSVKRTWQKTCNALLSEDEEKDD
jgi:hypothetical protein